MNKPTRKERLLPGGIPRWVRIYDSGEAGDRYTCVYSGRYPKDRGCFLYRGMSENPFHPQGVGMMGETKGQPADTTGNGWSTGVGRKNHLGLRIRFTDLPEDCQKLVLRDYSQIWKL